MRKSRQDYGEIKLTKNADGIFVTAVKKTPHNHCATVLIPELGKHGFHYKKKAGSVEALSRQRGALLRPGAVVHLSKEGVIVSNDGGTIRTEHC